MNRVLAYMTPMLLEESEKKSEKVSAMEVALTRVG